MIEDAWDDANRPGDDDLAGSSACCGEYAYVAEFFHDRHWRNVTLDTLRDYEGPANACCSFLSAAAFRYYLPAFMRIALDEPLDGPRSDWEASMVDVAVWALLPPRFRPEVHALEQSLEPPLAVSSPEATARLRAWWDARVTGFTSDQRRAIVAFLARMHERHGTPETAEAREHWAASRAG